MSTRYVWDPITKKRVRVKPIRVVCGNYPRKGKKP